MTTIVWFVGTIVNTYPNASSCGRSDNFKRKKLLRTMLKLKRKTFCLFFGIIIIKRANEPESGRQVGVSEGVCIVGVGSVIPTVFFAEPN